MFGWLKNIITRIKTLSSSIDVYRKDTIVQSIPALTYVNRAKKLIESNNLEEAEKVLFKALDLPQKDALVYKYLGVVNERLGRNELAAENYQLSADMDPQDKNIWQRLGFTLLAVNKFEQAEKSFENANKVQTGVSETFVGWGMALMKQKKYSESREKFMQAFKLNRYNFSAMFLCSVVEIKLEIYDAAEAKLSFLTNVCPNEANLYEYAHLKSLKNDYDNAIYYAKRAVIMNSKMLPAYILLGQMYVQVSDKEKALEVFEKAFEKDLSSASFYLEWGKALQKFERNDDAIQKFEKAYEINPEDLEVTASLGLAYVMKKEFDKADPLLKKVLEQDSENKKVKQAVGVVAFENGNLEEAISTFILDDENYLNCYYLAKCFECKNDDIRTVDYYEACLRLNPKYIQGYKDYVNYLISKQDYADAQRKLRKALKSEENDIDLLNLMFNVSYILVKDNVCEYNVKETLAIAEKIESVNPDLFKYPGQKQELINLLPERD